MEQIRLFRVIGLAVIALIASASALAQAGDSKDLLLKKLDAQFVPTRFTADKTGIVTAGAIVALQRDGLQLFTTAVRMPPVNVYKNGKLSQGMGDRLKVCMVDIVGRDGGCDGIPKKTLATGEKVWISGITLAEDSIQVQVVTDPYDNDGRYFATLKFLIPRGSVPTPEDAARTLSEILAVQEGQDQPAQGQSAAQPPLPPPGPLPPSTPVAYAPIAPPPVPPAPEQTLARGMTKDQVTAVMGEPARKAAVGPKEIFFYSDTKMKITFTNGKVSNIE